VLGYRPDVEEIYRAADCYVFLVIDSDGTIAMPLWRRWPATCPW
jgi:hypothetical protein